MDYSISLKQSLGIVIGFGILFSSLLNMTGAVNSLVETGFFDALFSRLSNNPLVGYLIGAATESR